MVADPMTVTKSVQNTKLYAQGLTKAYGHVVALKPIDLRVREGELLTLLGPSGSGKTTLLQLIAGLVPPTGGRLYVDGADQTDREPYKRDIGVVFQSYSLFPHLTVRENIAFPLEMRKLDKSSTERRISEVLEIIGLKDLAGRFPHQLSGGQQQRVALARCLVYKPSLILMDESLSALDRKLREVMQIEIKRIHRETGSTIIFVTHDQEEALALSDRICLMNDGEIEQIGTPSELYDKPRSVFSAGFIGISNIIRGRISGRSLVSDIAQRPIDLEGGGDLTLEEGRPAAISVRPESIRLGPPGEGPITGEVVEQIYAGSETRVLVRAQSGSVFTIRTPSYIEHHALGEQVSLKWAPRDLRVLAD
jgi:putative spermidine/putrescine transport system ATP-binding protein